MLCIDTGTTNTRVWRLHDGKIVAQAEQMIGVRDSARDGSPARLHAALKQLIEQVRGNEAVSGIIAAGMITSSLGLADVPHLSAPAGLQELAAATKCYAFPQLTELPVWLVPGIRCGPAACDASNVGNVDMMRGEETLCLGLMAMGIAPLPCTVFNLGSHWKGIELNAEGQIVKSVTSLTGELIHATQTQTILAAAVPQERPTEISSEWAAAGMKQAARDGLARTLFCVRLLEQKGNCSPAERWAFLLGAYLAGEWASLRSAGMLTAERPVIITGSGPLATLWRQLLFEQSLSVRVVDGRETEAAMLFGLQAIYERVNR